MGGLIGPVVFFLFPRDGLLGGEVLVRRWKLLSAPGVLFCGAIVSCLVGVRQDLIGGWCMCSCGFSRTTVLVFISSGDVLKRKRSKLKPTEQSRIMSPV